MLKGQRPERAHRYGFLAKVVVPLPWPPLLDELLERNRSEVKHMSEKKAVCAASPTHELQPIVRNPLDIVLEKIPFDVPYGPPISLERAQVAINAVVTEAKKRDWKMNVAVVDSGGNLVAFQRIYDGKSIHSRQMLYA